MLNHTEKMSLKKEPQQGHRQKRQTISLKKPLAGSQTKTTNRFFNIDNIDITSQNTTPTNVRRTDVHKAKRGNRDGYGPLHQPER